MGKNYPKILQKIDESLKALLVQVYYLMSSVFDILGQLMVMTLMN